VPAFLPPPMPEGGYRMFQEDVERGQEFRKCIECFMCQDVCHVIRDHEENKPNYGGTALFNPLRRAEMHPLDRTTGATSSVKRWGSATANITNAAPRSAPSTSRSPTTASFR